MKIIVTGGTGFIGKYLIKALLERQHQVTIVSRDTKKVHKIFSNRANSLLWNELSSTTLAEQDIVVHLAGQNVGVRRWSQKAKESIVNSRVNNTKKLAQLCANLSKNPPRILSASAIGIYGLTNHYPHQPLPVDESWPIPYGQTPDFLSEVGQKWETAWQDAVNQQIPVTIMRFGVVLHPKEGMLKKLLPSVKCGLAGKLGSGNQWLSWISINDLVKAILWLIDSPNLTGPINLTHPDPVQQKKFIKDLADHYHRPCFANLPAWFIRLLFGRMGEELLLGGQKVVPTRLLESGFTFDIKNISQLLNPNIS